jgi:hypothetical protein
MQRASTYTHTKNKDNEVVQDGSEDGNENERGNAEDEWDISKRGETKEREKWMQGLKTPNMRTIKILKSPSEKQYLII